MLTMKKRKSFEDVTMLRIASQRKKMIEERRLLVDFTNERSRSVSSRAR